MKGETTLGFEAGNRTVARSVPYFPSPTELRLPHGEKIAQRACQFLNYFSVNLPVAVVEAENVISLRPYLARFESSSDEKSGLSPQYVGSWRVPWLWSSLESCSPLVGPAVLS